MLSLEVIYQAAERIAAYTHRTPILSSSSLDQLFGKRLFLKAEHLQKTGSFKARGAVNAALQLERPRGLLAVSSGNHAQAVAYAAYILKVPALIVMPEDASRFKKAGIRAYGAEVYDRGVTVENREEVAHTLTLETGYSFIHPFNDPRVMAGQGTIALELAAQVPDLDAVLVAVGGGGMISGVAAAMKALAPQVRVIGVEPEVANDAQRSLAAGRRIALEQAPKTVADGVRTLSLGEYPWEVIRERVDEIVSVPEEAILEAQRLLMSRTKQVVEPTGALPLAPLLTGHPLPERLGIVVCGGNWMP